MISKHVQTTLSAERVQAERTYALRDMGSTVKDFHWDMIRLAFSSVAEIAIIPMQDLLGLDSSARMNIPGRAEGNWGWRFRAAKLTSKVQGHLASLTAVYARWNGAVPARLDPHHVPTATEMKTTPIKLGEEDGKLAAKLKPRKTAKKSSSRAGSTHRGSAKPRKTGS